MHGIFVNIKGSIPEKYLKIYIYATIYIDNSILYKTTIQPIIIIKIIAKPEP